MCITGTKYDEETGSCVVDDSAKTIEVKSTFFSKKEQKITIEFSEKINIEDFSLLNHTISENLKAKSITPKGVSLEQNISMIIQLELNQSYDKANYTINSQNLTTIYSLKNNTLFFTDYPISTEISFFKTASAAAAEAAAKGASYISIGMTAILMIVSFNAALILIKLF